MSGSSANVPLGSRPTTPWWRIAVFLSLSFIAACSGGSGGMSKIPGGYAVDKRIDNAIQVRITKGFFDFLEANGKALVAKFLPGGGEIPVPSSCGGDTELCCGQTCKVKLDYQSLKFEPRLPATTGMTLRAKIKTMDDFKIKTKVGFITIDCKLSLDTARRGKQDVGVTMAVAANVNPATKLLSLDFDDKSVDILDLDSDDIDIKGNILCGTVNLLKGLFIGTLKDQLKKQLAGPLDTLACQRCSTKFDCSSLANQGCSNSYCMRDGVCLQMLGTEGRLDLGSLLGAYSPPAKNASLDLYAAAGNYAAVEPPPASGMSLGMLGGTTSQNRSTCVPSRPAPVGPAPTKSTAFSGSTAPNGKAYHVGAGISTLELDSAGYTLFDTGGLCLDVGTAQVEMLSTGLLAALIPSLNDLTRGTNSALRIVGRPQQPPTFVLGKGTFKTDGTGKTVIDDPLLHVIVKDLALDFYVFIDERYVRFMRQTVDLDLPLGLDVDGANQLVPFLGDLTTALGNVRVTDSSLLKETPTQLGRIFPSLLPVLAGAIGSSLGPIKLPDVMGIELTPIQITSTADATGKLSHLGLFLSVKLSPTPLAGEDMTPWTPATGPTWPTAETAVTLADLDVPYVQKMRVTENLPATPRVTLQVGATSELRGELEWQYRIDNGLWRPFSRQPRLVIEEPELRLLGRHSVDVRARVVGHPLTLDPTPATVAFEVAPKNDPRAENRDADATLSDGQATGCAMGPGGVAQTGLAAFVVALLALCLRRRALAKRVVAACLVLGLSACKNDTTGDPNDKKNEDENKPKSQFSASDEIGRYQSVVVRSGKVFVGAYNATFGDLAYSEMSKLDEPPTWFPVDGLPDGEPDSQSPTSYRSGYSEVGDDVGRFASLKFSASGGPVIAYQDSTNSAVKLATRENDKWKIIKVADATEGRGLGHFTQLEIDEAGVPTIAYMVGGAKKANGQVFSQLVVATAQSPSPQGPSDFTKNIVEEVQVPCAGLCAESEACVYLDPAVKDRQKTACKKIEPGCTPSCKTGSACMQSKCVDALVPPAADLPLGTGLFVRLVQNGGKRAVVFYNRSTRALKTAESSDWKATTIDGGDGKTDTGRHIGALWAADGTLHVAYSDTEGRLYYRSIQGTTASPTELVDDGARSLPSPDVHVVGAGATVALVAGVPTIAYQDSTAGTLEVAQKNGSWMRISVGAEPSQNRGYYPQLFEFDNKWWVSDVVYDRNADVLTTLRFTALPPVTP